MVKLTNSATATFGIACMALSMGACATQAEQDTVTNTLIAPVAVVAIQPEPAVATDQSPAAIRAAARDAVDPIICKTERVTGSRLLKSTTCARQSERDNYRADTRIGLDELHRRSSSGGLKF